MENMTEQPKIPRRLRLEGVMRNLTVGCVIASGAVLWGYAVYHVAMRTM